MKNSIIAIAFLVVGCTSVPENTHIDLMYGGQDFDDRAEWEQTDQQESFGGQVDFCGPNGFGPEFGLIVSADRSTDPTYSTRKVEETDRTVEELSVGVRKNHMLTDWLQVTGSAGYSALIIDTAVTTTFSGRTAHDRELEALPYLQAGTNVYLTKNMSMGLLYRYRFLDEEADILSLHPDLDGQLWLLTMGWSF